MQKVIMENGKVVSATGELQMLDVIADLGASNDEDGLDDTITKTDSKTNIKLEASSGMIPDNTTMNIIEITSGATFDKIKNNLVGIKNFKAFDITLKSNDTNIQPKGKVKINIPVPEGFDGQKLVAYRFEEDGNMIEYQVNVVNGYAIFETEHLSTYILAETTELSNEENDKNKTDQNVGTTDKEPSIDESKPHIKDNEPKTGRRNIIETAISFVCLISIISIAVLKRM